MMVQLSSKSHQFPSDLKLYDVHSPRMEIFAGGGFGNICDGQWRGQRVALKHLRIFTDDNEVGRSRWIVKSY
jgi:hypothetical protein